MEEILGTTPLPDPRPMLNLPTVLHFLQREWSRFEHERSLWTQEKAELQARVAYLEGQNNAEESLKRDLLRRIKMLEYALKQERMKSVPADLRDNTRPPFEKVATRRSEENKATVREGRELLTKYLEEMGFTDAVLHAQAQRMKSVLDSWPPLHAADIAPIVSRTEYVGDMSNHSSMAEERAVISAIDQPLQTVDIVVPAEPDPLASLDMMLSEADGSDTGSEAPTDTAVDDFERTFAQKFGTAGVKVLTRGSRNSDSPPRGTALTGDFDLGELADFKVTDPKPAATTASAAGGLDSTSAVAGNGTSAADAPPKTWANKFTLRSHFDGVRAVVWSEGDNTLLSASEDNTVKLWHLPKSTKKTQQDIEASWTYRGHTKPVFSLATKGSVCFSGGADGLIRSWNILSEDIDKFGPYTNHSGAVLPGHTDVVWSLSTHPQTHVLLSCGADKSIRLWDTNSMSLLHSISTTTIPSGAALLGSDASKAIVGFVDGSVEVLDIQTGQMEFKIDGAATNNSCVTALTTSSILSLAITGHADNHLRCVDIKSRDFVFSTIGHQDMVTSLDMSSNGLNFVSSGHDRSIRIWDLASRRCVSEFSAHRRKFDEAIHCVRFHPTLPFLASCGADGQVRVYS